MNAEYFYGIVEDRHDPLMIGRVRVRVHGVHTDDKLAIATPDLPWGTGNSSTNVKWSLRYRYELSRTC